MINSQEEIIEEYRKHRMKHLAQFYSEDITAISSIRTNRRCAALTIDCGYTCSSRETLKNLLFMKINGIYATFFVTGRFISNCPFFVRIIHLLGFEVMNHSVSHKNFLDLDPDEQKREILANAEEIRRLTGIYPNLFRFPFGDFGIHSIKLLKSLDIIPVQWNVDSLDWMKERTGEQTRQAIMENISPGSIILCHIDGNGSDGIRKALLELKRQGYQFVTVNNLLKVPKEQK